MKKGFPLGSGFLSKMLTTLIEYETPKVVTVHNVSIGLLRRSLQVFVVLYVGLYQLWYAQGYQEFSSVESSTTTKVKGYSISRLDEDVSEAMNPTLRMLYERVWDEADYVVPPAENGAFFVTTNVVITPNQTLGHCPEDPGAPKSSCIIDDPYTFRSTDCHPHRHLVKSHGPQTGRCVPSDRHQDRWPDLKETSDFTSSSSYSLSVCEIQSWCPVEDDRLILGGRRPLITGSEFHTVYIKNSIRFSYFGDKYHRNNLPHGICRYDFTNKTTWLCNIFKLGDMVLAAGGNYTQLSISGGVVAVHIEWTCNLDWDFEQYCLPKYNFRLLDTSGWNFRHAHYHEEGRRTLYKAYGIKFVIIVQGIAGKFSLKNTVINVVAGLGLISFITMFCDFILLNYVSERKVIKEKKFDVLDKQELVRGMMAIISVTNDVAQQKAQCQSRETLASDDCLLEMRSCHRATESIYISDNKINHNGNHTRCENV